MGAEWLDAVPLDVPDSLGIVVVMVVLIIALALAWFFVLPALILILDVLLVLALAGLAMAARVLLRRPWIIEADSPSGHHEWRVVGWQAARRQVDEAARWLERGGSMEQFDPDRVRA